MQIKIAINGFGRIGRCIFRAVYKFKNNNIKIVAINSGSPIEQYPYYIKYDSNYRGFEKQVSLDKDNNSIICGNDVIKIINERDPLKIDWSKYGVDIVLECTGKFCSYDQASLHIKNGMNKVLISSPASGVDATIVYGVNNKDINKSHKVLSAASCTTNCLVPIVKVLDENFHILSGQFTTIHSYTNDQSVLDSSHKDLRRSRASAISMIPTSTGAAKNIGTIFKHLNGKISGLAIRVPTPTVSMVDFVFLAKNPVSVDQINNVMINASKGDLSGVLGACDDPVVSSDFIGNVNSAVVDLGLTSVINNNLCKVIAWYDNELAFAVRMLDICEFWFAL